MKICHIVPADYIEVCNQNSSMHLLISQEVLKNKKYQEKYLEKSLKGDFIIMDNGIFEYGNAAPLDDVIEAVEAVQAKEMILPDCYFDGEITIKRVMSALNELEKKSYRPISLMAVPQGKTQDEYMWCFSVLLTIKEINVIGFSYGAINKAFGRYKLPPSLLRPTVISYLNQHFDLGALNKEFHCLGIGGHPHEIEFLKKFEFIRSIDSSKAFVSAVRGIDMKETLPANYVIPERPDDYFNIQVSEDVVKLALKNIETMGRYNEGE
ncbi:MAG: hypothetical protein KAW92_13800 [Candidatus Cloacimonetes bacterium]|nr:hypothetical protein [Candidatus Cloacimonadota bacterium]